MPPTLPYHPGLITVDSAMSHLPPTPQRVKIQQCGPDMDVQTQEAILQRKIDKRRKYIQMMKNGELYITVKQALAVQQENHDILEIPVTPREDAVCTKREFESACHHWRRAMKEWHAAILDGTASPGECTRVNTCACS